MRGLAITVALVIVALCATMHAGELRTTPTGFEHTLHERTLIAKALGSLSCSRCHDGATTEPRGKLVGKPGHNACFGACHGPPPATPKRGGKLVFGERAKVCMSCHAESAQTAPYAGKLAAGPPPDGTDPDFSSAFGHKQHGTVACTQCHDMRPGAKPPATHTRCAGCHDGATQPAHGPAMSKCAGCHPLAIRTSQLPDLAAVRDSVTASFSHVKHATRGASGKECTQCHKEVATTDDTQLPRPTMRTCGETCHDGKVAFATTSSCTRCHDKAPPRYEVARPTSRFLHGGFHAETVKKRACIACHAIGPRGDTLVAGHDACVECHAKEFSARDPRVCGACHNATEPWRPLVADRGPAETTEFGAMLDHDKHPQDCARCHSLRTRSAQLRPPRGHASCMGAGCHASKAGPAPTLEACAECHRAGLAAARDAVRVKAPWSVRETFDHRTHAGDGVTALACKSCHVSLSGNDLLALPSPAKATCAPCHDAGKTAFKMTGTTCGRCHQGGAK